ncbi:killer cell lectin-like receptor 2 isoform X2 [Bos taurus]|uniref:killer cell lectin-like receptor 2 isoform X2 n=1 Tax=Bos taurus TaxID=9913 RepID=UPI0028CB77FD|nr:killer cell lectin-like receptor 2 isoform X2 [Bos taurus]
MKNRKESYSEPSLVKDTKRQQMRDSPSAREKLIVVILGIVCFVLMYTIVRVITSIPRTQISEQNKSSLVTKLQKVKVFQGGLPEPPLDNGTQENSASKIMTFKKKPLNRGEKCKSKWSCCGQKCYYFLDELKNFEESKKSCKEMDSTLLKIEDKEELNFIQSRLSYYFYWIGLSRKGTRNQWTWEDKSMPFLKSSQV